MAGGHFQTTSRHFLLSKEILPGDDLSKIPDLNVPLIGIRKYRLAEQEVPGSGLEVSTCHAGTTTSGSQKNTPPNKNTSLPDHRAIHRTLVRVHKLKDSDADTARQLWNPCAATTGSTVYGFAGQRKSSSLESLCGDDRVDRIWLRWSERIYQYKYYQQYFLWY